MNPGTSLRLYFRQESGTSLIQLAFAMAFTGMLSISFLPSFAQVLRDKIFQAGACVIHEDGVVSATPSSHNGVFRLVSCRAGGTTGSSNEFGENSHKDNANEQAGGGFL